MPALTFFTARLRYRVITGDEPDALGGDEDIDPQNKGINGGVTITAFILEGEGVNATRLQASTLSPDAAMLVLAPVRARIDEGRLKITADDQVNIVGDVPTYADLPDDLGPADSGKGYLVESSRLLYVWSGTAWPADGEGDETDDQPDVRLVAQTPVLGLPDGATLNYRFDFDHVTYGGDDQDLASFAIQAPTTDIVLDLATAPRIPL